MRLHPVNTAEAIIAPFFDLALSPENRWKLQPGVHTKELHKTRTYTTLLAWADSLPGETIFTWDWEGSVSVSQYNGMFLQCCFPKDVKMSLVAKLDGNWQKIVESWGHNSNEDYEGRMYGETLEAVKIELVSGQGGAGTFGTYYLGVFHTERLQDWLAYERKDVYPPDWSEYIKDESEWGELTPGLEISFRKDQLNALRAKINLPEYRSYTDRLREKAYQSLQAAPEKRIRKFVACGSSPRAYSARSRDRGEPIWPAMEQCAFIGLLDQDPALLRMAGRTAMSLVHTEHWTEGFVEHHFPGSAVNWRSFYQNMVSGSLSRTMDWIFPILRNRLLNDTGTKSLSPKGYTAVDVIAHSIYFKGLSEINYDFLKYEYIYSMNQAITLSPGRIASLVALNRLWPRVGPYLELAEADIKACAAVIIHEDGGSGEGLAYFLSTLQSYLYCCFLLAQHKNLPVTDLIEPGIYKVSDYITTFLSTVNKAERLTISDGPGGQLNPEPIALLARAAQDHRLHRLFLDSLDRAVEEDKFIDALPLIYGPDKFNPLKYAVPEFQIHTSSGHVASCREDTHGPVRFHLCGSSVNEGHSHADKGAILLEAYGESLLIDRGSMFYSESMAEALKKTRMHNAITLMDQAGVEQSQINPCPVHLLPQGQGDSKQMEVSIDLQPAWGKPVVAMKRRVVSSELQTFQVHDEVSLDSQSHIVLHFHSYAPIHLDRKNEAVFKGEHSDLVIRWSDDLYPMIAKEELYDANYRPVYHLALKSGLRKNHQYSTELAIRPKQ